jgi:hypothetical protein
MANSNYLTEIKKEYTIQLVNMLTPAIYEGINSIYSEVKKIAKDGEELKVFQGFLTKIPTWTEEMITMEAVRIKTVTPNADIIDDLIKAVIQSNILLLTSSDISEKHKVLKEFNINLNYNKFIHNVYIEVAKTFYNYPFLYFHKVPALEYKKNQLKSHKLIKEAIEESIRKMLPLQLILKKYLGIMSEINDDKYLKPLVNTESNNNQYQLAKSENKSDNSNGSDGKTQTGGVIQSQPPMSLKEIYEQQKKAGLNTSSIKHIPLSGSNVSESKKSESVKKVSILIPPDPSKLMPHFKNKNNDSESSQPYHKQNGGIEEEFSNMASNKSKNYKPELNTVSEGGSTSATSAKKNIFNFRGY